MGYNINKVRLDLEDNMRILTGDNNLYPTTLAWASAHILGYRTAEQKKG